MTGTGAHGHAASGVPGEAAGPSSPAADAPASAATTPPVVAEAVPYTLYLRTRTGNRRVLRVVQYFRDPLTGRHLAEVLVQRGRHLTIRRTSVRDLVIAR